MAGLYARDMERARPAWSSNRDNSASSRARPVKCRAAAGNCRFACEWQGEIGLLINNAGVVLPPKLAGNPLHHPTS